MVKRRSFVKFCASAVAAISTHPEVLASTEEPFHSYNRVRLVAPTGRPIEVSELEVGEAYLFQYPYVSTPCFLIDLGRPTGEGVSLKTQEGTPYRWEGGVGPNGSVVAFSAICAHQMTHPARSVSFINYRHRAVSFQNSENQPTRRSQIIYCCSERSVYDPTQGGRVLGGPAPQPLATIALEYDEGEDGLFALGTFGGEMFEPYFEKFGHRLMLEYETQEIERPVEATTSVVRLADFCRQQVLC